MTVKVELIYDSNCPNIERARAQLRTAFAHAGRTPQWREWDRGDINTPTYARAFGSPTILIDGKDAANSGHAVDASSCRVYRSADGKFSGVPALDDLVAALKGLPLAAAPTRWRRLAAAVPALLLVLLPKLTCPACWPAYAALLGAVGINFIDYTPYLLPLSLFFSGVALAPVYVRARARGCYRLLALGLAGTAAMLIGKFAFDSQVAMYAGAALLLYAVVRSALQPRVPACAKCVAS